MRSLMLVSLLFVSGCAGAFGEYGPGMANLSRSGSGMVSNGDGTANYVSHSYETGENGYGAQLGVRTGYAYSSAGSVVSGGGLAIDAHADFTYSRGRFGAGVLAGYTSDQIFGKDAWGYSGVPVGGYAQYLIVPRFFVHAGASYIAMGSVKHIENQKTGDANGYRGVAGLDIVLSRSSANDWMFRLEARYTKSNTAEVDSLQVAWSGTALLGEIVWATF